MVRSYHTLACALAGVLLAMLVDRGLDGYVLLILGMAVPWDKLAGITGEWIDYYARWRRNRTEQTKLEAAFR
jgi:hypothetical protein